MLLKLLVLDEDREMFGLPPLQSFSLINGLLHKNREEQRYRITERLINKPWVSDEEVISKCLAFGLNICTFTLKFTFHIKQSLFYLASVFSLQELRTGVKIISYLSLLGQISGELGLDSVSDLTSWDKGQISAGFWSLQTEKHISVNIATMSGTPSG